MCIRGTICRALDTRHGVHIPIKKSQEGRKLINLRNELVDQLEREPSIAELALKAGISREKALGLLKSHRATNLSSLDAPVKEDGSPLGNLIKSEVSAPEKLVSDKDAKAKCNTVIRQVLMANLSLRDKKIVEMRFGLRGYREKMTLLEIGEEVGLTRERVRQVVKKAIAKLSSAPQLRQAYADVAA